MTQLARLLNDHANLIEIAETLLGIVSEPIAHPTEAMSQLGMLSKALDDHLTYEHAMLAQARQTGVKEFLPLAAQKGDAFYKLVTDWVAYLAAWPETQVRSDWSGFTRDTLSIIRRLVTQIEMENEAVRLVAKRQR